MWISWLAITIGLYCLEAADAALQRYMLVSSVVVKRSREGRRHGRLSLAMVVAVCVDGFVRGGR